eukprot:1114631-Pelagomonas_calceolata.AAC.1
MHGTPGTHVAVQAQPMPPLLHCVLWLLFLVGCMRGSLAGSSEITTLPQTPTQANTGLHSSLFLGHVMSTIHNGIPNPSSSLLPASA